ncbi:restriction endonuclease subunit S [Pseudomonas sp. S34]|uniref:restriction endonuclease subunit S n=1 Tax=Pseudomonas sp. S34 TaxID=1573718 RepID=UPI0013313222|nr:restriction endonuclease subunit S [Pseudomonas sp. S34]
MSELPKGWAICTLADIGQIVTGKTPSTKEPRFYDGNVPFIKPGDLDHSGLIFQTESTLTDAGAAEVPSLPPQSIVVTCIGNLGKVGLTTRASATNQQINAVIPDEGINPSFLFHFCKTLKPWLESKSSATTISIVNKGIFSKAPAPLAPLAEQTRIALKLNELLAQVDTLKARIDAIPALLKRFRQSTLAEAVSGRLTEKWRDRDADFKVTTIGKICSVSTGKTPKRGKAEYWEGGDIPWLTSALTGTKFCSEAEQFVTKFALKDCTLKLFQPGTLLMAMYGEGKTRGQVTELKIEATCNQACAAISVNETLAKKDFVKIRLQENYEEVRKQAVGGAQPNLNLDKVKEITICLPSMEEQTEIVRRVEQLFTFADQLEAKVASAKSRIDHLTQSILAKAFRGELVPQDPSDEPASELLARIQAQRAAAPKAKAKRGRKSI